ncbi:YopX family protein [Lacticaseibacillus paracasei]|uniref:YopX family protein n=1 Tax=Lacticaseibacillus paracasei TaxID=1597 RepID=UPI003DA834B8
MKREIKFRVWDHNTDTMMIPDYFELYDGKIGWIEAGREAGPESGNDGNPDQFEIMQYTGLHDKNGREIYENDILKVTSEEGESYVATVKWFGDEGYPAFDLEGIPETWFYGANALATIFQEGVDTCEVIGNIFENPELLEGKQ